LAPAVEARVELAPEVVDAVKRTLKEAAGEGVSGGGYTVTTTIDPRLQAAARKALRDNLDAYDKRYKLLGPVAPPPAPDTKGGKNRKTKPAEKPFAGVPNNNEHRILTGVVVGTDDTNGMLDVQVGAALGSVKLADYERYNPQALPPSRFA